MHDKVVIQFILALPFLTFPYFLAKFLHASWSVLYNPAKPLLHSSFVGGFEIFQPQIRPCLVRAVYEGGYACVLPVPFRTFPGANGSHNGQATIAYILLVTRVLIYGGHVDD